MKKFFNAFTSLRGFACLFVIIHHVDVQGEKKIPTILHSGGMSVDFYFVLSAYLLTNHILLDIEPDKNHPPKRVLNMTLVKYAVRRFLRVYPAFIAAVFFNHLLWITTHTGTKSDFEIIVDTISLKIAYYHFWTLRIEMYFYFIILPIFAIITSELLLMDFKYLQKSYFRLFILFILAPAFLLYKFNGDYPVIVPWYAWKTIESHFTKFYFGMLGGIVSHYLRSYEVKLNTRLKIILTEIVSYLIMIRICIGNRGVKEIYLGNDSYEWVYSRYHLALFYSLLLLLLEKTEDQCSLGRFLSTPALVYIGKWSYSIYLVHWCLIFLAEKTFNISGLDATVLATILSICVGFVLYTLVENACYKLANSTIKLIEKSLAFVKEYINKCRSSNQMKQRNTEWHQDNSI